MKVTTVRSLPNDYGEGEGYTLTITSNGKNMSFSAGGGEPEDNSLSRDLHFVLDIPDMLKMAYEAGKNGEEFELTKVVEPETK